MFVKGMSSPLLKVAELIGINWQKCRDELADYEEVKDDIHLCAYKPETDACRGDSGGNLHRKYM